MLSRYIQLQEEILNEKKKILKILIGCETQIPKMKSGKLHFVNFSDITNSWAVKDLYKESQKRLNADLFNGEFVDIPQTEIDSIKENIMCSKDLIVTLSTMLQYGNTTKSKGLYFHKLSESTINKVARILGVNYQPQTKRTRNISGGRNVGTISTVEELQQTNLERIKNAHKLIQEQL